MSREESEEEGEIFVVSAMTHYLLTDRGRVCFAVGGVAGGGIVVVVVVAAATQKVVCWFERRYLCILSKS